jgi:hypothetical protein
VSEILYPSDYFSTLWKKKIGYGLIGAIIMLLVINLVIIGVELVGERKEIYDRAVNWWKMVKYGDS